MHDRPRVVIAGDSYSDPRWIATWKTQVSDLSWVRLLESNHTIRCVARMAASNWDIWRQCQRVDWDLLIVNLTSVNRITRMVQEQEQPDEIVARNFEWAERIASLPNCYAWSPFPEYEHHPTIHFLPLEWGNEMYDGKLPIASHHLTPEANQWLAQHMDEQIKKNV